MRARGSSSDSPLPFSVFGFNSRCQVSSPPLAPSPVPRQCCYPERGRRFGQCTRSEAGELAFRTSAAKSFQPNLTLAITPIAFFRCQPFRCFLRAIAFPSSMPSPICETHRIVIIGESFEGTRFVRPCSLAEAVRHIHLDSPAGTVHTRCGRKNDNLGA